MRILVVDDSRAMRMIVSRELRRAVGDVDVLEAEDVSAAAGALTAEVVDLVLCDWNMPGATGLELLRWLRAQGWHGPFGFVTSEAGADIRRQALDAGASFVVTKPFKGDDLADAIAIATGGSATHATAGAGGGGDVTDQVAAVLGGLLGRAVQVEASEGPPRRELARVAARYVGPDGQDEAMCVAEVGLAAAAGAALSMLPATAAGEWADSGVLPEAITENFAEVANVLASVVSTSARRRVLAGVSVHADFEALPNDDRMAAAAEPHNLDVRVDGYGAGRMLLAAF